MVRDNCHRHKCLVHRDGELKVEEATECKHHLGETLSQLTSVSVMFLQGLWNYLPLGTCPHCRRDLRHGRHLLCVGNGNCPSRSPLRATLPEFTVLTSLPKGRMGQSTLSLTFHRGPSPSLTFYREECTMNGQTPLYVSKHKLC